MHWSADFLLLGASSPETLAKRCLSIPLLVFIFSSSTSAKRLPLISFLCRKVKIKKVTVGTINFQLFF